MGIFTSKCEGILRSSQKGQSIVEYVLLLAVVGTLLTSFMNSDLIKDLLGPNSGFFASMKNYLETTYQYGHYTVDKNHDYDLGGTHDMYSVNPSESHFFAPTEAYK
jgi:hypothetical protein